MNLVERAKNMILKPADTWPVIEQESTDWQKLYVPYMVTLAAIPALCGFIGMTLFGVGGFGFSMRIPVVTGLGLMVSQYIMTLVMVFVWGWLISMLAKTFGGQPNLMNAVKLTVYASTPAMVAGIFQLIPSLAILAMLGGLYSLYVMYLGLPVLMKNPPEKSLPYMVVAAVIGIVCMVLISAVSAMVMPSALSHMSGRTGSADIKFSTPNGDVQISGNPTASGNAGDAAMTIKTADGEVKIDLKGMEDLAKRLEAAAAQQEAKK